ncbi:MAG TPA: LLM class flavin-dependent oxidoreductase, partial [Gaiellaceae bacterium]|nr:LLM class flavin-dependent oxidoreductase [Gaiellaceae bacterium]
MVAFHVGLLPGRPAAEVADLVALAEDLGFEGAWIADSQSIFRDAYISLALAAERTSRIALATGVTNPVTRHAAVIASAIATVNELSQGRAILGIGVGESAVHTLGLPPARLDRLAEVTAALRALLAGEETELDGRRIRLAWSVRPIPIWFASSSPRSLRLAGRVADGVLFQVGAVRELVRYALAEIAAGETAAGRKPGSAEPFIRLACSIAHDREWARSQVRAYVAGAAGTAVKHVPREHMPAGLWEEVQHMRERYDYYAHMSAAAPHGELVTDTILDAISISGTPEEAIPRFRELMDAGVRGFCLP